MYRWDSSCTWVPIANPVRLAPCAWWRSPAQRDWLAGINFYFLPLCIRKEEYIICITYAKLLFFALFLFTGFDWDLPNLNHPPGVLMAIAKQREH